MIDDFRQRKAFRDYARAAQLQARLSLLRVVVALAFLGYLGVLWYYQVVRGDHFQALSDSNRIRTIPVTPLRGTILDRHGRILAKNRASFTVVVDTVEPERWAATRDRLAKLMGLDPALLEERWRRAGGRIGPEGIVVQEDVDFPQVAFIEAHPERFPGVRIRVEPRRLYEGGILASHLVGYVGEISPRELEREEFPGTVPGDVVGKAGVERQFNASLMGSRGQREVVVNARGRELDSLLGGRPPVNGSTISLALDLDLQRTMAEGFGSRAGSAVFLDPRNGEVLALGSFPGFDPNLFAGRFSRADWEALAKDPRHPLQNRAAQSLYSAGSTFKLVVAAAALDSGVIGPGHREFCGGGTTIYGRYHRCHFGGGHGWVDLHRALVKSCNVYFYRVGTQVGIERIADYARRLGLGRRTGVELAHEDAGLVPDEEWSRRERGHPWYPGETVSVSIGQGPLLVTPLQMAALAGAVGTGAFAPLHLILGEAESGGRPARPLRLSAGTLNNLRRALWGVVNEDGTGTRARLAGVPGVEVAGKTGTVQVVAASAGVDSEQLPEEVRDHSWFVGYAPADAPSIAFAVFVEHGGHGGTEAAPIAREVLQVYFGKAVAEEVQLAQR